MAKFFICLLLQLTLYIGYAFDVIHSGPRVKILNPSWRGQKLANVFRITCNLQLYIGMGPDAVEIQTNPNDYKVCITGGKEISCSSLFGGAPVGFINISYYNGISEVSAWMQHNDVLESMDNAIGEGDIVIKYDSPLEAIPTLQDRVKGVGHWKRASKSYLQALRQLDLGRALMKIQPTEGVSLTTSLVKAGAALGQSVALGNQNAIGVLEELFWLSGSKDYSFPLFECKYNDMIDIPLIPGGPRERAVFSVYLTAYFEWADARDALSVNLYEHCEGHSLFDECVSEGLIEARHALLDVCGDLADLASVVKAHANNPSDINEHILTLEAIASETSSVLELGVQGCSSSWAFLQGLIKGGSQYPRMIQNDINDCFSMQFDVVARNVGVNVEYHWKDDLTLQLTSPIDLIFIDTYHVYGQLKRELAKFSPWASKYIVLHDTTVDGEQSELVRTGHDKMNALRQRVGWSEEDVTGGLWRAVEEFLATNEEWTLQQRYTNNNGLTVLRRVVPLKIETEVNVNGI